MSASTKPLHVLRGILRHLGRELPEDIAKKQAPALISGANTSSSIPTRSFLLQQYRVSRDATETSQLRQLAANFLALQKDLKERDRLYELDGSAETLLTPKEMSRRAAARAGLQLPDLDPKLD